MNKTLVQLLKGYTDKHPMTWDDHVVYIQYSYNTEFHSSTQKYHFQTCYSYLQPSPFDVDMRRKTQQMQDEAKKVDKLIEKIKQVHLKVKEQHEKS